MNDADDSEQMLVSSKSESTEDVNVFVRSNALQRFDYDAENDQGCVTSTQDADSSTGRNCAHPRDQFMHYLLEFDVKPCLLFRDAQLMREIYRAIPQQALEMIPITRFTEMCQPKGPKEYNKYCPLLPPLTPAYQLTIEASKAFFKKRLTLRKMEFWSVLKLAGPVSCPHNGTSR